MECAVNVFQAAAGKVDIGGTAADTVTGCWMLHAEKYIEPYRTAVLGLCL